MSDRDGASGLDSLPDHDLAERVRDGERLAFGLLYQRHHVAAWGMACVATGFGPDAEIALMEGFAGACAVLPVSLGPGFDLRAHLLAGVRRAATRPGATKRQEGAVSGPVVPVAARDDAAGDAANSVRAALCLLPEDWRSALWLTEVEGMTPLEVSAVVGLAPARVIPLRWVTWEMVRAARLEADLRFEAPAGCRPAIDRLGPYSRGELSAREQILVKAHFSTCEDCARRRRRLADPEARLVDALRPAPPLALETADRWLALIRTDRDVQPEPAAEIGARVAETQSVRRIWLDPLAASTPAARRFAAWTLATWGATEMLDVVQLLTSELVTNALVHSCSPVQLVLDRRPDALRIEVRHEATHTHSSLNRQDADPGHCLLLMEALADAWGVTDQDAGKIVWFEIAHPRASEAPLASTRDADLIPQTVGAR